MCPHRGTRDLQCFNSDCGPDCHVCCLHTDRDQVCYDYQSVNEDYKLGILKCCWLQPVFAFPLSCAHNVEVTRTMCTVHMQVFCCSWVNLYKLVVLEYMTAHVEF